MEGRREGRGGEREGREKGREGEGGTCSKVLGGIDAPGCPAHPVRTPPKIAASVLSYEVNWGSLRLLAVKARSVG